MKDDETISRNDVIQGLLYEHSRINLNTIEAHKALASVESLLEVLIEQGVLDREIYEQRRKEIDARLRQSFVEQGMGVAIQEHETGKYEFEGSAEIDCENRVHLCKAACCRLSFALSKEDVEEAIVRWDLGHPYLISRTEEGCCAHLNPKTRACGVYEHRPIPCRQYDCRKDKRVWIDFDGKVPNPKVGDADWPKCLESELDA